MLVKRIFAPMHAIARQHYFKRIVQACIHQLLPFFFARPRSSAARFVSLSLFIREYFMQLEHQSHSLGES